MTDTTVHTDQTPTLRPASAVERRLGLAAGAYAGLGLLAGLFYRTLTHSRDFTGQTVLSLAHTHLLALGMLLTLVVLLLERGFGLSTSASFRWFEPMYHVGMAITVGSLIVRGTLQVVDTNPTSMAFAGVAGLGHILLTVAFVVLFWSLRQALRAAR